MNAQAANVPEVPPEFQPITAHLVVPSVDDAVKLYTDVFGGYEVQRNPGPDGKVWHAEMNVAGVRLLLMEEFPDMELVAPRTRAGARGQLQDTVMLNVFVDDVDESFRRATAAGATALIQPHDAFWGDRYAEFRDGFGHRWALSRRLEHLAPDEMQRRADDFRARHGNVRSPAPVLRVQPGGQQQQRQP